MKQALLLLLSFFIGSTTLLAQWSNRYPKVEGFNHHVYLEGFELPILSTGPMDPAPSPLDKWLVFSAKGWLWLKNFELSEATRITSSPHMDSRPEWSPDGKQLVFVRDDGENTFIVHLDMHTGKETVMVNEAAIDLDPVFDPDGKHVYYASAVAGTIDIWKINLDTRQKTRITSDRGLERRPWIHPDGNKLFYLNKVGSYNSIEQLDLRTNERITIVEDRIASQADLSVSPDGNYMTYTWPYDGGYEIRLMDLASPNTSILLTRSQGMPLAPEFSDDSQWIYFSEATGTQRKILKRISINGGRPETLIVDKWNWGEDVGRIKISTRVDGEVQPVRLNVLDKDGHPIIPDDGTVRFDGQNGRVFFYADGSVELMAIAGEVTVSAVQGFETVEKTQKVVVKAGELTEMTIDLERIWDASDLGWYSGDNHFHLNYGGTYRLAPQDIVLDIKGEAMDVGLPLLANLHNRFLEQELWGWQSDGIPIIAFGQEVRSHFLGHIQLIGTRELFWPWVWGPYYQVYSRDDRTNAEALRFARKQGGLGGYVHPVAIEDPFTGNGPSSVPINLVADAVLGEVDLMEVACLWTDERGTGALWHELLNLGLPIAATGGSDVMNDYYRTMAVGATRVYVKPEGELTLESYLKALKEGKSFVSNGPMIDFRVADKIPGEVITNAAKKVKWNLEVHSALPYETVEVLVNGKVVWTRKGNPEAGSKTYAGSVTVPSGGWVAARVHGGTTAWPSMDSYPFAETSPVWWGKVGSTDPEVMKASARRLLNLLDVSEERLQVGYGETPIPNLQRHFRQARRKLEELAAVQELN